MVMDEICKLATFLLWMSVTYSSWYLFVFLKNLFLKDDKFGAEEVENLKSLVSNLRQLLDLHRKYNCRLSLSVFEKVCLLSILLLMYSNYT